MEAPTPRPGQMTLWTMQSIAHGADFVSYFRWRTCTFGTEMYWHGILDYSGRDNRRLKEVADIHTKINQMMGIVGSKYEAELAVLCDYDNIWDSEVDKWHGRIAKGSHRAIFEAAQLTHTPLDYVYISDESSINELSRYKVIFYPHASIMTEKRAALLTQYVKQGGTLILGCRSGYKDINGICVQDRLPGLLTELTGTDVTEYSFIAPDTESVEVDWDGHIFQASIFTDMLAPCGTGRICAKYSSDYAQGTPALICNEVGAGLAYYYGSAFNRDIVKAFLEKLQICNPYKAIVDLPECCEVAVREKNGERYMFILNYAKDEVMIDFRQEVYDLFMDKSLKGKEMLNRYDVKVVKMVH